MPRLFFHPTGSSDPDWRSLRLAAPTGLPDLAEVDPLAPSAPALLLPGPDGAVALVARRDTPVRVNGRHLTGGLRLLRDRDEIRLGRARFFLSTRDPLTVEPFPGPAVACPRCSDTLRVGTPAVRCHCGLWFHQSPGQECFTYADKCPQCRSTTALEVENWHPASI